MSKLLVTFVKDGIDDSPDEVKEIVCISFKSLVTTMRYYIYENEHSKPIKLSSDEWYIHDVKVLENDECCDCETVVQLEIKIRHLEKEKAASNSRRFMKGV